MNSLRTSLITLVVLLMCVAVRPGHAQRITITKDNLRSILFVGGSQRLACYGRELSVLASGEISLGATLTRIDYQKVTAAKSKRISSIRRSLKKKKNRMPAPERKRLSLQLKRLSREISSLQLAAALCNEYFGGSSSSRFSRSSRSGSSSSFSYGGSAEAKIVVDEPEWYHKAGVNGCAGDKPLCYFPDLGMSLTRGYAPFGVFFQGSASTPREAIARYSWDFGAGTEGDSAGRYFEGINAAHIFETPGQYQVTLTVTDYNGASNAAAIAVTVLAPDGPVFYLDAEIGDDACDGRSPERESATRCPWQTAAKAFNSIHKPEVWAPKSTWLYQPGTRVLFKRGQTFNISRRIGLGGGWNTQGITFAAYGDPAQPKPLIQWTGGSDGYILESNRGAGYWSFVDLQFNFKGATGMADGLFTAVCSAKNITFLRCDFYEPRNGAWSFNGGSCLPEDNRGASGFMFDSTIQNPTTHDIAVTQMYHFGAYGLAIVNNIFDKSGNHMEYSSNLNHAVIAGNIFSRPAFGRTAWRTTGSDPENPSGDLLFADNYFLGWIDPVSNDGAHNGGGKRYNYHLLNFAPGGNPGPLAMQDIIFERNVVTNFEFGMDIVNAENMTVRNNIFVSPSPYAAFVQLSAPYGSPGLTRALKGISVVNNTFVSTGSQGPADSSTAMLHVHPWTGGQAEWGPAVHEGLTVKNNIFKGLGTKPKAIRLYGTEGALLSNFQSDRNVVHIPNATGGKVFQVGTDSMTMAEWRSSTGKDLNSVDSDPNFALPIPVMSYAPGEPGSAEQNYLDALGYVQALRLSAQSPLGLGEIINPDTFLDFDLVSRHSQGRIDPGAFQFGSN